MGGGEEAEVFPTPISPKLTTLQPRTTPATRPREKNEPAGVFKTPGTAMLMGEGKKAALVLHYICPIMEFV